MITHRQNDMFALVAKVPPDDYDKLLSVAMFVGIKEAMERDECIIYSADPGESPWEELTLSVPTTRLLIQVQKDVPGYVRLQRGDHDAD